MRLTYNSCSSFMLMIGAMDLRVFIDENAPCGGHIFFVSLSDLMHTVGLSLHVSWHTQVVPGY